MISENYLVQGSEAFVYLGTPSPALHLVMRGDNLSPSVAPMPSIPITSSTSSSSPAYPASVDFRPSVLEPRGVYLDYAMTCCRCLTPKKAFTVPTVSARCKTCCSARWCWKCLQLCAFQAG